MDKEQRIQELNNKIISLSKDINSFREELDSLRAELAALSNDNGRPAAISAMRQPHTQKRTLQWSDDPAGLENYIGLRFIHIIGVIVLVIGLSIGVKYAIDKELISASMRILLAYAAGASLFFLSWRLKNKYHFFSAILFSGSMASVYFTTYAAFVYYGFFPVTIAFGLMIALTIFTVISAIRYNRQEIAVLGMIGAYGIPFLVSANAERIDLFFSYILLINIGVAFISFRKSWKLMQYLALIITWMLFAGWSFMRFERSEQLTGIVFMSVYYILFLVSAMSPHTTRKQILMPSQIQQVVINNIALYIAAVLIFGNGGFTTNLAATTGFMSLVIAIIAFLSFLIFPAEIILQRVLAWQAILMLVFFIGLQWDGVTVTVLWVIIAVVLFIWGIFNKRSWPRMASILLVGITLVKLVVFDSASFSTIQKIISFIIIGVLLLLFSFYYQKFNLLSKDAGKQQ